MSGPFPAVLVRLGSGQRLTRDEAREAMDAIMEGEATPTQIGAFLMALRVRGETPEEITGAAESMRSHATRIEVSRRPLLDTCGTGGDGSGTFNISTAAAFVLAGAGLAVAKHGNRSVSSRCGSADVLEALGVHLDLEPEAVQEAVERTGFGFLFAPRHHAAMKHAVGPRREMAMRTLFNVLGPLTNPAGATHQVLGVFDPGLTEVLARVLGALGSEGALVVHGEDGLDELTTRGATRVSEWRDGSVRSYRVTPEEVGLDRPGDDDLAGGDAEENARRVEEALGRAPSPARDVVCLNAGAAIYIAGAADTLKAGVRRAEEVVESGAARRALDEYVAFSRSRA